MLKIFVSAYACEPGLGSEIGVGWHWVLEMSKYFELWVLTRQSNRDNIERHLDAHPEHRNIHFLYYDLPKWARFWKKGLRGVRTYYNIWQFMTRGMVERTMTENNIPIFHHLTYGNVVWNVSSFGQRQFFIWGPVGGLECVGREYSRHYPMKARFIESLRRCISAISRCSPSFRRRCRNADLILCKTDITRRGIPAKYAGKAILFTDVATDIAMAADNRPSAESGRVTKFITVGRLDAWRGFDLIIEAMARLDAAESADIHLTIVGEGSDRKRLTALIAKYNLQRHVTMTGNVPMEEYRRLMNGADAVINAALKEGAVTVSFDSMSMGKPLICIDTTGYTRYFADEYAIVIPCAGRDEVIGRLAAGILRLTDADTRMRLGTTARMRAADFSWEHHGVKIKEAIEKAYNDCLSKQ